ncbi:MAG: hypothetical protein Q9167_003038 [Letrouitia subvulpina]
MQLYYFLHLTATVFSSLIGSSVGQDNDTATGCSQNGAGSQFHKALQHPNASASYKLPSFTPPGKTSIPPGDWAWNTTITVLNNTITQSFSIDTPTLKDIDDDDIPYEICAMAIYNLPKEKSLQGQDDNGDCKSTLSQDCVNALVQLVNTTAASFSAGAGASDDVSDLCGRMLSQFTIPDECQQTSKNGAWSGGAAGRLKSNLLRQAEYI